MSITELDEQIDEIKRCDELKKNTKLPEELINDIKAFVPLYEINLKDTHKNYTTKKIPIEDKFRINMEKNKEITIYMDEDNNNYEFINKGETNKQKKITLKLDIDTDYKQTYKYNDMQMTIIPHFYPPSNKLEDELDKVRVREYEVKERLDKLNNKLEESRVIYIYLDSEKVINNLDINRSNKIPDPEYFMIKVLKDQDKENSDHNSFKLMNYFKTDGKYKKSNNNQHPILPKGVSYGKLTMMKRRNQHKNKDEEIKYYLEKEVKNALKRISDYINYLELSIKNIKKDPRVLFLESYQMPYTNTIKEAIVDVTMYTKNRVDYNTKYTNVIAIKDEEEHYVLAKSVKNDKWHIFYSKEKELKML